MAAIMHFGAGRRSELTAVFAVAYVFQRLMLGWQLILGGDGIFTVAAFLHPREGFVLCAGFASMVGSGLALVTLLSLTGACYSLVGVQLPVQLRDGVAVGIFGRSI